MYAAPGTYVSGDCDHATALGAVLLLTMHSSGRKHEDEIRGSEKSLGLFQPGSREERKANVTVILMVLS